MNNLTRPLSREPLPKLRWGCFEARVRQRTLQPGIKSEGADARSYSSTWVGGMRKRKRCSTHIPTLDGLRAASLIYSSSEGRKLESHTK